MPEPGESAEPLATRSMDATFCHVVELFATTGSVGSARSMLTDALTQGVTFPAKSRPRNCTSVAPSPDTATCVPVVSGAQVAPPSVDVRELRWSHPEPPVSVAPAAATSTDATSCHAGDPPVSVGLTGAV